MDWSKYAWVKRGKRRQVTLVVFNNAAVPLTINDIHMRSQIAISQASTTVSELEKAKLIECLNPKDKIGKLYKIAATGKEIIVKLEGDKG